uniref:hypothetical protein n=1 Tax=Acinetobacter baumannii TaxID=470 RepID=UPI0020910BB5
MDRHDDEASAGDPVLNVERRSMFALGLAGAALGGIAAGGLALPAPAAAQGQARSKLHVVKERGKLIVGTGSTNPPWH